MDATAIREEVNTTGLTTETTESNRAFRQLWAATTLTNLADGVALAAAPLLAATLTRDPALVAGLVVAQRLPWFLFSLVSGALVDRLDRRRVLGGANLFRAIVLGVLGVATLAGWASLPLLYAVFFLLGTAETFADNASLAILPAIVPREGLERANGRLFATHSAANEFIGPPLGSLLFALLAAVPLLGNAAWYLLAAALVLTLRGRFRPQRDGEETRQSLRSAIGEGLRWFWRHPLLRILGGWAGASNLCGAATTGTFVLVAQDRLGLSDATFGLVLAGGAFGGVAGGLVAERITARLGGGTTIFATNLLTGVAYLVIAATTIPLLVSAMFAAMSFAAMIGNVIMSALRQGVIPDALLGRVTSAYRLVALGALPLGALVGGTMARIFGLTAPYWVAGVAMLLLAFALLPAVNNRSIARVREEARG